VRDAGSARVTPVDAVAIVIGIAMFAVLLAMIAGIGRV
jgi:hypothetical protein